MSTSQDLQKLVEQWVSLDPDPVTRAEIQDLWDKHDYQELDNRLRRRIEFGTAGLRGKMEAGWARMNDLIIIQASQGLAEYVLKSVDGASTRGLVVGYDHRHHSEHWARLTARAFIIKGIKVYLLRGFNHTPMVPFGVQKLHAACGVMITASHNPKQDNGYKVYWENAVQIIAPHDKGISESIQANLTPLLSSEDIEVSDLCFDFSEQLHNDYFKHDQISFVNTSLHGVSHVFIDRATSIFSFMTCIPVPEQQHPDADFPTVAFPNPEEKGTLDLAIALADQLKINYVFAQDPDADRFIAAEKSNAGNWNVFSGDQLGVLFASNILQEYKIANQPLDKLAMVASTVSSKMLQAMAKLEGFKFVECLTGFKFIGNTALQLAQQGFCVPFGYEEAIGFMFGSTIRDKDGVAATISFAGFVAKLQSEGKTVQEYLEELYLRYGYFKTRNGYFFCSQPQLIDDIFAFLRNYSGKNTYPQNLGGLQITHVIDLTTGYDSENPPSYKPLLPLSSGHMIQVQARDFSDLPISLFLTLRTSGTEPKVKFYLEGSGSNIDKIMSVLQAAVEDIKINWMQALKYKLEIV